MLEQLFNAFGTLKSLFVELAVVTLAAKEAIHLLEEGIKHGAEAYQNAAKTGTNIATAFALSEAFKAIGMGGAEQQLLATGQFNNRARRSLIPGTDEVVGAARTGQFANLQQFENMHVEFDKALQMSTSAAYQMQEAAGINQILSSEMSLVGTQWKAFLSQMTAVLGPLIDQFLSNMIVMMAYFNSQMEPLVWILKKIGLSGPIGDFNKINVGSNIGQTNLSSYERIGFHFDGGLKEIDHLSNIEKNTAETNQILTTGIGHGGKFGGAGAGGEWPFRPAMPVFGLP